MPTDGLSLVGFIDDQRQALKHLKGNCVAGVKTDSQLIAEWQTARINLGPAAPKAGQSTNKAVPASHRSYLAHQAVVQELAQYPRATVEMVEIDPLLVFQFTVDLDRAAQHASALSHPPTLDELFATCLPINPPPENLIPSVQGNQSVVLLRSPSLNLRLKGAKVQMQAAPTGGVATVEFGISSPFVHITRFNGRCYLNNGLHRAYGARLAGASLMPCIFRDVSDASAVGIKHDGSTLGLAVLESDNPPTVAHFVHGRALPVALRRVSRLIQFTWGEYVVAEE
jgi:hypothetical protein